MREFPLDNTATEILICSAFPFVVAFGCLFLQRLVDKRYAWVDAFFVVQIVAVPCVLFAAAPHHLLAVATPIYNLLALEFMASVVHFMWTSWRSHRKEFWLMGAVVLVALVLTGVEFALQNKLLPLP